MSLRNIFKPKPNKFLKLLVEQTDLTVKGLEQLKMYLTKRTAEGARQVATTEKEADEVRRIVIEELMRTFVTPFDREDIFSLSREIDDVLDYANTTVDEMEILDVTPTPYMARMASLLFEAAQEIEMAVERLQDNHLSVAQDHAQRAKAFENRVEQVYREAIADLFRGPKNFKHVMTMLKVREIYRHLSNAADREDTAANVISDIIMKMS
jgi:predicted phosphate transport protein (TIGR00153 family)